MTKALAKNSYNGVRINFNGELINLTNMWKAAGGDENQKPQKWLRQDGTRKFLKTLTESPSVKDINLLELAEFLTRTFTLFL